MIVSNHGRMQITVETFAVSVLTSLIVSLVTFIFGLKSGKNQADREKLQELYRKLYVSFLDLKECVILNKPRRWEDYGTRTIGNITQFLPTARKMTIDGTSAYIKSNIIEKAIDLENRILTYGVDFYQFEETIFSIFKEHGELLVEGWQFRQDKCSNKGMESIDSVNRDSINPCTVIPFRYLLDDKQIPIIVELLKKPDTGLRFELMQGNRIAKTVSIYPGGINTTPEEYINTIVKSMHNGMDSIKEEKGELLSEATTFISVLKKRTQDPYTFQETIVGAILDIFNSN